MPAPSPPRVALFVTCLANVFRPTVAESSVELLRAAGCEVHVSLGQSCCGQPGYNSGAIASARPVAQGLIRLRGRAVWLLRRHDPPPLSTAVRG